MSSLRFADGAYLRASGTRDAFGQASDRMVRDGYPPITVVSGDREYADQVAIFLLRYVQVGDIRGRRVYDVRYWNGVAWYRISAAGTVAVPGTSNHESRRAADLGYPYNDRTTAAHRRLQQIAWLYGLKWTGVGFGEDWHWENVGALGAVTVFGMTAGTKTEEEDMTPEQSAQLAAIAAFVSDLVARDKITSGTAGDLSKSLIVQGLEASIELRKRFLIDVDGDGSPDYDLTQLALNEIKPMLQTLLAAVGRASSTPNGPIDIDALAAAIREGLGDEVVDKLAQRLAK
ncbi:M15 family metallopeptidase [Microbacterium sp. BG28]|uniref:M15 family metallopeptidase n=1 Tax=Microbacterium sp. BG28 TaxID=3097356 RepID=UPI002A5A6F95|nr:M15 family metallopeptidase [Microbacterium sp. BG28]MDY0830726.1 M15 family metallopeptidase [Microbacterium sp. BG28]